MNDSDARGTNAVGVSTGAVAPGDAPAGVQVAGRFNLNAVELSALHEAELDTTLAAVDDARARFRHLTVHAPTKGRRLPERDLVERLAGADVDVVAHPDAFTEPEAWRRLGPRLLVENADGRKPTARTVAEVTDVFAVVADARMCLDVSHALHAGGPQLVEGLLDAFASKVALIHVGCPCGEAAGDMLDEPLLAAVRLAREVTGAPVILERPVAAAEDVAAQLAQVFAALR